MKHNYHYEYCGIVLRPLNRDDIEDLRVLRNKNRACFLSQSEISEDQQRSWYQQYLEKENDIMFTVTKVLKNEFIGSIAIYDIDLKERTAEIGRILIDRDKITEKGYGTTAVEAITSFAFNQLKLRTLKSIILKENVRSIKIHQKAGFNLSSESNNFYVLSKTCL